MQETQRCKNHRFINRQNQIVNFLQLSRTINRSTAGEIGPAIANPLTDQRLQHPNAQNTFQLAQHTCRRDSININGSRRLKFLRCNLPSVCPASPTVGYTPSSSVARSPSDSELNRVRKRWKVRFFRVLVCLLVCVSVFLVSVLQRSDGVNRYVYGGHRIELFMETINHFLHYD